MRKVIYLSIIIACAGLVWLKIFPSMKGQTLVAERKKIQTTNQTSSKDVNKPENLSKKAIHAPSNNTVKKQHKLNHKQIHGFDGFSDSIKTKFASLGFSRLEIQTFLDLIKKQTLSKAMSSTTLDQSIQTWMKNHKIESSDFSKIKTAVLSALSEASRQRMTETSMNAAFEKKVLKFSTQHTLSKQCLKEALTPIKTEHFRRLRLNVEKKEPYQLDSDLETQAYSALAEKCNLSSEIAFLIVENLFLE